MKRLLLLIPMLFVRVLLHAQAEPAWPNSGKQVLLDGPRKNYPSPLWLLKHKNKVYSVDTTAVKEGVIDQESIASVEVFKDKEELKKYGDLANNGVIVITLTKKRGAQTFRSLKRYLKEMPL